jgi:diphthamide synthase (EF-2-diphthine--ammonia ligase)
LFLAFGDQKTSSLIRFMQAEQVDASAAYDRKDWLVRVAALFHLRMNFLWLMQRTHYLEELVLHSFDAWVVGLLDTRLEQDGIDTLEQDNVDQAIQDINAKGFMDLVEDVRRSAFEPQA